MIEGHQLSVEGIMVIEKHHLALSIVIIHPGKKSQWIIKLVSESKVGNETFYSFKVPPCEIFVNFKGTKCRETW